MAWFTKTPAATGTYDQLCNHTLITGSSYLDLSWRWKDQGFGNRRGGVRLTLWRDGVSTDYNTYSCAVPNTAYCVPHTYATVTVGATLQSLFGTEFVEEGDVLIFSYKVAHTGATAHDLFSSLGSLW